MSKAFTKEDDEALEEVLAAEDQGLPPGTKNYVTPEGATQLQAAIERLRSALSGQMDARRKLAVEQRLAALLRRLEATEVVDVLSQPNDRVLFGSTVTVRGEGGRKRRYRIVGVDEADPKRGWVSWRSPVACALLNLGVGDAFTLHTPGGEEELEVTAIDYGEPTTTHDFPSSATEKEQ